MDEPEINISIEQKLKISLEESWLQRIAVRTIEAEGIPSPAEMGLVITDSKTIQKLNKTYRGEDKPTDVLAFHMIPGTSQEPELRFVGPPDGIHHLGEVVISYPQAIEQAQEQGHGVAQELALLIVHGVLHLLGYDHELPEEEQKMKARENEILKRLDFV
ncbi:MAG: rRNA maturation RNase YbeY [Chloroflexi bacterium]|nr:rRNA maturation RNase YbeY [Chloroflexota bacterium]MBL7062326.1 rRNA maturation RNase YbeY [Dehalococcoidia bacterium]